MKRKKLQTVLVTALLSLSMLTGCSGIQTYKAVQDTEIYSADTKDMLPCYLNNTTMYLETDILESESLKGYVDNYTLELFDDDVFILLCNMPDAELTKREPAKARDCLQKYFKDTALSLNMDKITGKYLTTEDTSPISGKDTFFYKVIFSGVKFNINKTEFEGSAALLSYDDICVACIIGTNNDGLSEKEISNMMRSVCLTDSEDFSTSDGTKPTYKVPKDLNLNVNTSDIEDDDAWDDEVDEDKDINEDDIDIDDDVDVYVDDDEDNVDDDDSDDEDRTSSAASSDIYSNSITINDITLSLPCSYDDLIDLGLTTDTDRDCEIGSDNYELVTFTFDDGSEIQVNFSNYGDDSILLKDCDAENILVDSDSLSASATAVLGKSIILGETTRSEIMKAADGKPDFEYDDGSEYTSLSYESKDGSIENSFDFWEEVLISVNIYHSVD